ncbi:dihydroneopterin triphosphate diphosphatase [Erwinia sp. OLTSP20]|uniref:dihydroneopterin triphosphate diphosphatase n=1 Tax=unclassified Erwinia TaxID=2622719 RepID=UPI000C1927AA|nr:MULTISPECIES: dihydroneopterin triphosphate diphosphatase [unclassified Erwinia]PIJ50919.1 dihydroneopterin triphosphate diphosphatase [Erwinia sp. OAMSP11]PIJ75953.1 dihydroneopterin triphosphate diphosphatase [Erwinia sp. OLSSP12]PIJ83601.1 dihydroneopterin triphosphate diphosphatase [Erwinia sp. OLCASP19]PIJ87456.1 dihydroneopterin triphosphate diphosphatase [Erwinia sp. OLMTSP26]PIJ89005.1 dihydroneopterin triphosphate diphosphatase [Erwinia sp. OLMDSP33]
MRFKQPVSVLVVISAADSGRVLMLQRRDDPRFWQSVTGSLEAGECPLQAAEREVLEELAIDIRREGLQLDDLHHSIEFEIFAQFRHRYAPEVTHNREHWFRLILPHERQLILSEHLAARWLEKTAAAALTKSWSNRQAIEVFV